MTEHLDPYELFAEDDWDVARPENWPEVTEMTLRKSYGTVPADECGPR
ncbi:hypothetical protein [Amycolatopsis sp. H20-H5]|nr:hypothetical protein [Amycolatopsis sp. H20-H5]MEC3976939.1 hypothetical protein [Amycolatopsis sp. H20-H5]